LEPFDVLLEAGGLAAFDVPERLLDLYGGPLGFAERCLYANFVSTLDGVVAIPSEPTSPRILSDASEPDRFLMGLLRACADVVLVGAGTVRSSPGARFTPDQVHPPSAEVYVELRRRRGRPAQPEVAILTGSGDVDPDGAALAAGALVLTTARGAAALEGRVPPDQAVAVGDGDEVDVAAATSHLRTRGHSLILSEGGPAVFGSLLQAGLVDELFLTVSPLLAGRRPDEPALGLVEGHAFLPDRRLAARLLSLRRHGDHLFLRYGLGSESRAGTS
jgi:riboflavin biosynthesis pyrimidine reductase